MAFLRSPRRTIEFVDKCEPLLWGQFDMLHDQFTEYPVEPAYRIIMHFNSWLRCKTKSKMKKVIMPPHTPPTPPTHPHPTHPQNFLLKGAQISTGNLFFKSQGQQNRRRKKGERVRERERERERERKGGGGIYFKQSHGSHGNFYEGQQCRNVPTGALCGTKN